MTMGICSVPGLWRENLLSCIVTTLSCPNTSPWWQPWSIVNTSYNTTTFSYILAYKHACMLKILCVHMYQYGGVSSYIGRLFKGDVDLCFLATHICSLYVSVTCIDEVQDAVTMTMMGVVCNLLLSTLQLGRILLCNPLSVRRQATVLPSGWPV